MGLVALYQGESGNAESCFREALNKDPNGAIWPTGIRHSTFLSYLLECRGSRTEAERVLELSSQLNRENNLVTFEKNVCPAQVIQDVLAIPLIRGERTEARRQLDLALTHGWRAVSLIERNPIFMDFMEEDEFRQVRRNIDKDIEALCRRVTLEWPEWINENAFNPGRGLLQPGD